MSGPVGIFTKEMLELLAKKSGDTQVATTGGSYEKAGDILRREGIFDNVLDYGAGRGHGTQHLPGNAQSYEPNPKPGYSPDFTESPDATYDGIANLNVLNVVPEPMRSDIAQDMIGKLNKDGVAAIGARSYSDVMNAKNPELLDDGGIITQKGTYQYGFGGENEGLVDYLQRQAENFPDRKYEITKEPLAATGALVKRLESIMGPAVVGTAAGGAALAPEDAEAGVAFGLAKNVDMDRLVSAWQKAVSRQPEIDPSTHLQNIIHNKAFTNYDEFGQFARKEDGGKNGDTYFNQLKPFLIDISKHPKVAKDNRLRKGLVQYADTRFAQRKKAGHRPDVRAVGAPTADGGLMSAQLNNHDEAVDQHMMNIGVDPREDPMYDYGSLLPIRENIVTGESEMAMPSFARDMIRSLFDIAESRESNVYKGDAMVDFL